MYEYRNLGQREKIDAVRHREKLGYPRHAPPHLANVTATFLITAATYEHRPHFSEESDRVELYADLLRELEPVGVQVAAWVILPNHYHLLLDNCILPNLVVPIRRVHARSARKVNQRDGIEGRRVWYRYSDRRIRDSRHYYASLNYIHHNPVKHGYAKRPLDWPTSSAHWYLEHFGVEWLRATWTEFPIKEYGRGWDD